jgi:hypothetical protein
MYIINAVLNMILLVESKVHDGCVSLFERCVLVAESAESEPVDEIGG